MHAVDLDVLRVFRPRMTVHDSIMSCLSERVYLSSMESIAEWIKGELRRGHVSSTPDSISVIAWVVHYVYKTNQLRSQSPR